VKVFEASYQEGVTERTAGSDSQCTEVALLNSAGSDKDVLRHKNWKSTTQGRPQGC
jgi:hypothetical protein